MTEAYIPYGGYWSTPFAKWQGTLSHRNSVELAAHVAKDELDKREINPADFDMAVLGITVPQHKSFYGAPWMTAMMGAEKVTGPTVTQACATSARCLQNTAQEIGEYKAGADLEILQPARWREILETRTELAEKLGVDPAFILDYLDLMHKQSIALQKSVFKAQGKSDSEGIPW